MSEEKTNPAALVTVRFHDDDLLAVRDERGVWVSIKRVCESLEVDYSTQLARLKKKAWATMGLCPTVGSDGKSREMQCIHVDALPMWLATIDADRVAGQVRPKLERFQIEAARALRDHFARTVAHDHQLARLREYLAEKALPHKVTWKDRLVKEIARLYGYSYTSGRHPRWMANVQNMLYRAIYGDDIVDEIKRRNPTPHHGSNHHQHVRHHDLLEQDLQIVHAIAITSISAPEFWQRIAHHFRRAMMQIDWTAMPMLPKGGK